MKKMDFKDIVNSAWTRRLRAKPELREEYGDDGWTVWEGSVYKLSQEDIARLFGVSYRTSQRWHEKDRLLRAA